jgi:hypothetical protein
MLFDIDPGNKTSILVHYQNLPLYSVNEVRGPFHFSAAALAVHTALGGDQRQGSKLGTFTYACPHANRISTSDIGDLNNSPSAQHIEDSELVVKVTSTAAGASSKPAVH